MQRISNYQLFTMTVLFQIGTTILFGFSASAGRDGWLATLLSTLLGTFIILMYTILMRMQPGLTLIEWYPAQLGRWIGTPIAWMYALEFMYDAGRGLADIKDLIPTTLLHGTPSWVILGVFMIVLAYGLYSGIEVLGRLAEMILPIIVFLFFLEVILLFSSGIVQVEKVQPILDQGWGRIWESVWPLGITQSFGQTIEFAVIWTLTRQPERIMKTTILATIFAGIFITMVDFLSIAVLGEGVYQRSMYPMYVVIRQISVADFITNMDAIGILYFTGLSFCKFFIHMFVAIRSIQLLTNIEDSRFLILPVSILVFIFGMTMATNSVEHIYVGLKIVPQYLWLPLFIIFPALLLIVTGIRKIVSSKKLPSSK